jgi:hypothetical protein
MTDTIIPERIPRQQSIATVHDSAPVTVHMDPVRLFGIGIYLSAGRGRRSGVVFARGFAIDDIGHALAFFVLGVVLGVRCRCGEERQGWEDVSKLQSEESSSSRVAGLFSKDGDE